MKLNWAERLVVNNPLRIMQQQLEINWLEKRMALHPGSTILEVGCGRGAAAGLLRTAFNPKHLFLLDLDEAMLRRGYAAMTAGELQQDAALAGDVGLLPFRQETFDAVFGFGVLHHVEDWKAGLGEISRVLKAGGTYCLEELYPGLYQNVITKKILLHPEHNRFTGDDLRNALAEMNLAVRDAREIPSLGILALAVKSAQ